MDRKQLKWLEGKPAADASGWKAAFFHHPPYSSGVITHQREGATAASTH